MGLVLGLISLITWLIPLFGLPISIWGLVASIMAKVRGAKGRATVGIVLCSLTLLMVLANAAVGAYLGATGQHELVNKIRGQ
jgi:hypothetical protein